MDPTSRGVAYPGRAWWIFLALVVVWNIPNLMPWEKDLYPDAYWMDMLERLLKCALLAAMFTALFARPWVAWLVSWLLGLWWLPISVAVRHVSDSQISATQVGMAMASSAGEIRSLVLSAPVWIFGSLLAWNLACGAVFFWLRRQDTWRWGGIARGKIFVYSALLLLVPYLAAGEFSDVQGSTEERVSLVSVDPFQEGDQSIGSDAELPRAFPYELPWALAQYWQARQVVNDAMARMREVPETEALQVGSTSPDLVVLVIGESSTRSVWGLFNASEQATTPRLQARLDAGEHLLTLSNVVAQSTSTRQAVPSMLTPQPLLWPDGKPNPTATRSIVAMATKAGYATAWFSNQAAVGQFDGVIAAYSDEAQTRAFLNPASFSQQGSYDDVLVSALQRYLPGRSKALVVLHTMGSHFRFDHRYPPGFGPFPAPGNSSETYRNSVAYTDHVLDSIIATLEQDGRSAVMLFVSDHGQGLAEGECKRSDVNRLTAEAYEVPALVWLSTRYATQNPAVVERLRANEAAPYTTAAAYQTLRDLIAGDALSSRNDSAATPASFLRRPPASTQQMVVAAGFRWVNFPDAAARDRCLIKPQ